MNEFFPQECHDKPIKLLNEINPNGYLIGIEIDSLKIKFISENISDIFNNKISNNEILENQFFSIFEVEIDFSKVLEKKTGEYQKEYFFLNGINYFVIIYHNNGFFYIELERDFCLKQNSSFHSHTEKIIFSKNIAENWLNLIHSIKSITGYNRIMIYKFKEDGSGESIAETVDDNYESYLNLRFPDFDISQRSRELFLKKRNLLVTDVSQVNSKIISNIGNDIDLTYSEFRTLSKSHIQYLKILMLLQVLLYL